MLTGDKKMLQFNDWISLMYTDEIYGKNFSKHELDGDALGAREITFQVTDACNLACTYCYQTNKGKRRMSKEVAKRAVDMLLSGDLGFREYISPDNSFAIVLSFIGGEPFLEIDLIDYIVDYFREQAIMMNHPWANKMMISICSNGVLYNDPKVQKFLQKNSGNISFSVTVDGTKELHDACRVFPDGSPSYDLAHEAAMNWKSRGYYIGTKITIAPNNVVFLKDCLIDMIKDGHVEINANFVYEKGWEPSHAKEVWKQCKEFADWINTTDTKNNEIDISFFRSDYCCPYETSHNNNWCGGVGEMLAIDPEGKIYPCLRYMESSLNNEQPPIIIGDVWRGICQKQCECNCVSCMKDITRRSQSDDECFYCPVAGGCSWCSAYNYQVNGTIDKRVTYICDVHKAQALGIVYYWNTFYKKYGVTDRVVDLWVPKQWAIPIMGEEDYNMLVALTKELGGYVNESATMVNIDKVPKLSSFEKHKNLIEIIR